MFTGIVEEMGEVDAVIRCPGASRLGLRASRIMQGLAAGDSVAVNGACLTVLDCKRGGFSCDLSPETMRLTNLGELKTGDPVNLERAMRLSDRLSGHLVSGHVEGQGKITAKDREGNALLLSIEVPPHLLKYCIPKGSIALDGVSMTLNSLDGKGITISVIPHTAAMTTLGQKGVGSLLNVECDLIGKYVERLLQGGETVSPYLIRNLASE